MNKAVTIGALMAATILFGLFIYLMLKDAGFVQYSAVGVMFVFTLLATRLEDLKTLAITTTGITAELERKLQEAQATITQLQRIAELFGKISVEQVMLSNRMTGLTSEKKRQFVSDIEAELKAIGLSKERVAGALSARYEIDTWEYYHWVARAIPHPSPRAGTLTAKGIYEEFPDVGIGKTPSAVEVSAYFTREGITDVNAQERLKDWHHYERTGSHRRVELWDARD